jgi:iron(III) transport system permease protein
MLHPDMRSSPAERSAITVVAVLLVAIVAVPAIRLTWEAFSSGTTAVRGVLTSPDTVLVVRNTVVLAAVVTVLTVPTAAAIALALRRTDVPARGLLRAGVLLPVFVPPFVLGYSWTLAYGKAGLTDSLFGLYWPTLLGPAGIVVVLVVNAVPVAYLVIAAGLATHAEPDLERAARTSGASAGTVLRTVTLPLVRPSLVAAAVLTFVLTLESFAIPRCWPPPPATRR